VEGGYRINGVWQYASGAGHATHFTANCRMEDEHGPITDATGSPVIRPFLFLKEEVTLVPSWRSVGLTGTGSHSFAVTDLTVPAERCFRIDPAAAVPHTLYRYPFLPLAEATIAVNLSGMALHFLDLCEALFQKKREQPWITVLRREELHAAFREEAGSVAEGRRRFYEAVDGSWDAYDAGSPEEQPAYLDRVSAASHDLAATALRAADRLYPYCGLSAVAPGTELNRVWRDIHTACQHPLLTFSARA
jgi:alkylation response protein AidB-like acyl-CoA dehydrogenase